MISTQVLTANHLGICYFEVEIVRNKENSLQIGIGNGDDHVTWSIDGRVFRNFKQIQQEKNYNVGDTIGIGYFKELSSVFFIKNGRYAGIQITESAWFHDDLIPYVKGEPGTANISTKPPFAYDVRQLPLLFMNCDICAYDHPLRLFIHLDCGCKKTCKNVSCYFG
jgi:hypothetical protein